MMPHLYWSRNCWGGPWLEVSRCASRYGVALYLSARGLCLLGAGYYTAGDGFAWAAQVIVLGLHIGVEGKCPEEAR
jgi:hypothetical protein